MGCSRTALAGRQHGNHHLRSVDIEYVSAALWFQARSAYHAQKDMKPGNTHVNRDTVQDLWRPSFVARSVHPQQALNRRYQSLVLPFSSPSRWTHQHSSVAKDAQSEMCVCHNLLSYRWWPVLPCLTYILTAIIPIRNSGNCKEGWQMADDIKHLQTFSWTHVWNRSALSSTLSR